jgi:hypothetical protein
VALSRATNLPGLILKTFDAQAVKAHPEVRQFYRRLGYTGESEHQDTATVASSVLQLADLYLRTCEGSGLHPPSFPPGDGAQQQQQQHHAVYARAPPQTSSWIMSRQQKASKKRRDSAGAGASLYDVSEAAQLRVKDLSSAGDNPFAQFEYGGAEDSFMERDTFVAPRLLPKGLEETLEPYVTTHPQQQQHQQQQQQQPPIRFSGGGGGGKGGASSSSSSSVRSPDTHSSHSRAPSSSSSSAPHDVKADAEAKKFFISEEQRR